MGIPSYFKKDSMDIFELHPKCITCINLKKISLENEMQNNLELLNVCISHRELIITNEYSFYCAEHEIKKGGKYEPPFI